MTSSSRTALAVALLLALAAVVFLVVGNPFAPSGDGGTGAEHDALAPGAVGASEKDAPAPVAAMEEGGTLGAAEAAGQGEVRARLLGFRDRKPIAGQVVRVALRGRDPVERTTGEDGRVSFPGLRVARTWTLSVEGKTFSPVEIKAIAVAANTVTDLGDLLLGDKVVLRGKVVDDRGRPIVGAAVSAYVGGGLDFSQGFAIAAVQSAVDTPLASDQATTDDQGVFALASLTPGRPYQLEAKHPGFALAVRADLVVSPDRGGALMTIVLGASASVRGRVADEDGRPVAGATVIALEDQGFRNVGTMLKRDYATTKPDGTYVIDTLSRGSRYRFGVNAKGYAPLFDGMTGGTTIETEATRDFTLVKGGAIAGHVTDKATGRPVEGARVVAIVGTMRFGPGGRRGGGAFGGRGGGPGGGQGNADPSADEVSTQIVLTGADGAFRIEGVKPGPVALGQVKAPGYADFSASAFPGSPVGSWGDVKAGETLDVNVALEAGGTVTGRVLAATPSGTVPVAGAQVSVLAMSFQTMFTGFATALTGEDGSFSVTGIRGPGTYTVTATAPGLVAGDAMSQDAQVQMPEGGGTVTKDVVLTAAGVVRGVVTDTKGAPVGAARVRARPAPGGPGGPGGGRGGGFSGGMLRGFLPGGGTRVALTDDAGRYELDSVAAGERTIVVADADEYVASESDPFEARAGEVREVNLLLSGGATLRGRVVDDSGSPVAGARLRVGHLDADNAGRATLNAFMTDALLEPRVVFTDEGGLFEIPRIQAGRTLLKAEKDGYAVTYRRDLDLQPDEVRDNHVVTLVKGQSISGVVKGEDGKPVVGAVVGVTKQENPQRFGGGSSQDSTGTSDGTVEPQMSDRTDAEGRFTVENVPTGPSYTVVVYFAPGYRGFAQGDEGAVKRGVPTGTRDVELVLKVAPAGESPFPMPRPPAGTGGPTPTPPRPTGPGMGGGSPPPMPTGPGMGG